MMKSLGYSIFIGFIVLSCNKSKNSNDNVPYVSFEQVFYTSQPQFFNLQVSGGWVYAQGGSKGLILFRANQDEIYAYDRHTPYQVEKSCAKLSVDSVDLVAKDGCSESTFLLSNGAVITGPAKNPLQRYSTDFDGNVLRVFN